VGLDFDPGRGCCLVFIIGVATQAHKRVILEKVKTKESLIHVKLT
jgi:hypothetical protein